MFVYDGTVGGLALVHMGLLVVYVVDNFAWVIVTNYNTKPGFLHPLIKTKNPLIFCETACIIAFSSSHEDIYILILVSIFRRTLRH